MSSKDTDLTVSGNGEVSQRIPRDKLAHLLIIQYGCSIEESLPRLVIILYKCITPI